MAPQLLFGLLLLIAFLVFARWYTTISPAQLARGIRAFVAAFGALAGTGLLFAGRFGLALITLAAMVMAIRAMRHAAGGGAFGPGAGHADPGRSSEIVTETLRMALDHATGELEGEVLRGPYRGRTLGSLGLDDLFDLVERCRRDDPQSVPLLETYLDRREPDWRGEAARRGRGYHGDAGGGGRARGEGAGGAANGMDEAQALEILGLPPGATPEEIKAAHRRLMARFHPDRGGSTYLAAQINRAKDYLLRRGR
jgi:DnaJ domain